MVVLVYDNVKDHKMFCKTIQCSFLKWEIYYSKFVFMFTVVTGMIHLAWYDLSRGSNYFKFKYHSPCHNQVALDFRHCDCGLKDLIYCCVLLIRRCYHVLFPSVSFTQKFGCLFWFNSSLCLFLLLYVAVPVSYQDSIWGLLSHLGILYHLG